NDSTSFVGTWESSDVYVYDRVLHTTELVSVDAGGNLLHGLEPSVSAHGRYVLFSSGEGPTSIYVRDRVAGTTTLIYDSGEFASHPAFSANGRFAVIPTKGSGCFDFELVVVDVVDGSVERVDVTDDGEGGVASNAGAGYYDPVISGDGRFIGFKSGSW